MPSLEPRETARALDLHTSIASAPSQTGSLDTSTGEVVPEWDPTTKWELQAVARHALGPKHRLRICYRHLRPDMNEVQIRERIEDGARFLGGLQVCGSVWVCPVCAPKIQAVRAAELRSGIDAWTAESGRVLMMTQTFRHSRADELEVILDAFKGALRKFRAGRGYQTAKDDLGLAGTVAGHEVTWGDVNGWHPHAHALLFVRGDVTPDAASAALWPLWESAAHRSGLEVSPGAFDVADGGAVRTYLTKLGREYQWNAEHELVKSHTKRSRSGLTPFGFLHQHVEDPADGRWLARFAEFGYAFHGKNQLTWSRGFKRDLLGTDGVSDADAAASIGEPYHVLARITAEEWGWIRRAGHHGGTVLRTFDLAGWSGLRTWIDSMKEAA